MKEPEKEVAERTRIKTELRESKETLAALVRTASRLITLRNLDEVSRMICEETAAVLDIPICTTRIFSDREKRWIYTYGHGLPPNFGQRLNLESEPIEQFTTGEGTKPYRVATDVQTLTESPNFKLFKRHDIRTAVDIDMIIEKRLIGRLTIATTGETRDFSENEFMLLKGLADQAALAIQNAQLLDQVESGRERLHRLNRQLVNAQEKERMRIARELHDEAGQSMTAMKINLDLLGNLVPENQPEMKEQLADLSEMADEIMEKLRRLAYDLRPPALDTLGLNKSLEGHCRQFAERTGLDIQYTGIETADLSEELTITIYRFLQEALTNVGKHADAERVDVQLEQWNGYLALSIKDDGKGFQTGELNANRYNSKNMGLSGMRERLELIGGQMAIESDPGEGAEIVATIPLPT